ncbi:hypothetical protein GCM10027038_01230 [Arthrobacter bambusae]
MPADVAVADGAKILAAIGLEHAEVLVNVPAVADDDYTVNIKEAVSANFDVIAAGFNQLHACAFKADIVDGAVVGDPRVVRVIAQDPASVEATEAAGRLLSELVLAMGTLAPSLAAKEGPAVSPQVAFSLAEEEKDLRAVEEEFGWLDSGGVAEQLGKKRSRTLASNMRAKGQLLGYVRRGQQAVRFPKFQFDGMGVLPVIPELISIANERGVAHEDLLFWLCAPTGMLEDDARPVDRLRKAPDRVLAAARYDLGGHVW